MNSNYKFVALVYCSLGGAKRNPGSL